MESTVTASSKNEKIISEDSSVVERKVDLTIEPQRQKHSENLIPIFEFTEVDYINIICDVDSPFDRLLRKQWTKAMNNGTLNYSIQPNSLLKKTISDDKYKFVVALLEGRGPGKRRAPDTMLSLKMPFDPNKFNFTKVNQNEILFIVKSINQELQLEFDATMLVNKSPIEYCSSLLVPNLDKCLPQVMTEKALHLAISLVALSDFQSLRLGFNSLGSMASVNHLHWHVYYFDHRLPIEDLPVQEYVLQNWPVPAIVFDIAELNDDYISVILKDVMRIIEYCLEDGQICYNLFVTRSNPHGNIRILIWLLEPRWGMKDNANVNVAFCELSGYFMCKTKESYEQMNEQKCLECFSSVKSLHEKVLHLLQ